MRRDQQPPPVTPGRTLVITASPGHPVGRCWSGVGWSGVWLWCGVHLASAQPLIRVISRQSLGRDSDIMRSRGPPAGEPEGRVQDSPSNERG